MKTISRRQLLGGGVLAAGAAFVAFGSAGAKEAFPFRLSDAEWKKRLGPAAYAVLRHEATERPWSSALLKENRRGVFICAGCALPLFRSESKYDSRTGWPSFKAPIRGAVGTATDYKIGIPRTEVHCRRCGGHLGHVFDDGPRPTGQRYCINSASLNFVRANKA